MRSKGKPDEIKKWSEMVIDAIEKVFFGKREIIEKLLVALLCRGHVLIEDIPGVGKTILAKSIACVLGGDCKRIQCTPDLLPADVIGVSVYNPKEGSFHYRAGPVSANIVLVDEINRATPRTQSALLEAMGENQLSVDGALIPLPEPFFLMATENPIEFEGTFPLPEAQKDRFLVTLRIGYPSRKAEEWILESQRRITHPVSDLKPVTDLKTVLDMQKQVVTVHVNEHVRNYILDLVESTRKSPLFQLGISPRGTLALYKSAQALACLRGRDYVVPEDVKELVVPVFIKRVIVKSEHVIKGMNEEEALREVTDSVGLPVIKDNL